MCQEHGKDNIMKKQTYAISHEDKTITLTKDFAKKSSNPATREFKELASLHKNFPDYDIIMRTAYVPDSKDTGKGLTIEQMKRYLAQRSDSVEALAEFERVQAYYGREVEDKENPGQKIVKAPYGKMKSWFLKKYKNDYKNVDFSAKKGEEVTTNED